MLTPLEAVTLLEDLSSTRSEVRSTGFSEIDRVTGGFISGQVWILTATPGQGRSVLASQWARTLAGRHGWRTQFVSLKEPSHLLAARLLANAGVLPALEVWRHRLGEEHRWRLDKARGALAALDLTLYGPEHLSILDSDDACRGWPEALVIDDADMAGAALPQRIDGIAAKGTLIILTLPRHLVVRGDGLAPEWSRVADVILDIRLPDFLDSDSTRPGEADFILIRNRWGPRTSTAVLAQTHYSRFIDMTDRA